MIAEHRDSTICGNTEIYSPKQALLKPLVGRWLVVDAFHVTDETAPRIASRAAKLPHWSNGRRRILPNAHPSVVSLGGYASAAVLYEMLGRHAVESKQAIEAALRAKGFWIGRSTMMPFHADQEPTGLYFANEIAAHEKLLGDVRQADVHITVVNKSEVKESLFIPGAVNLYDPQENGADWKALDSWLDY